ncbi:MAG: 1-deoxy-D-xylulose-5-phosphate reductoisomerase [Clostridia bacterium]|nr:1-deoxy-D-xylulose-5-phosphate reductoisomerase [Clostridia bacterium]
MNYEKHITVLGSTGSIGTQALDMASFSDYQVDALAFGSNIRLGEEQIRKFKPKYVAVSHETSAKDLKIAVADTNTKVFSGKDAVCEMLEYLHSDVCINAISGFNGLRPTLSAIEKFPRIGLANKETIVAAGEIVMQKAKEKACEIIPVDSEHSAIFQCLEGNRGKTIRRILLTCSGGPFFSKTLEQMQNVTVADALGHPTWRMGAKITIDSATLMNKGLELIEAMHLFAVSPEKIEIIIHRESIIHSMVEYNDRAVIAQLGVSDMRLPIQYAVTYPEREISPCEPLDFTKLGKLTFFSPDRPNFPLLSLAENVAAKGGILPCVMNAANEEAVGLFLQEKIRFTEISDLVSETVNGYINIDHPTLAEIETANISARKLVRNKII